jgi:chloramphenicol-sensitive protein RarD
MNRGIVFALSAYIFWGLHPIYWKQLQSIPSSEIVAHRIIWSLIFFVFIISFRKQWPALKNKIVSSNQQWVLFLPSLLIGSNWAMYIWAVNAGFIIETSLGYFISPLISVFLGVFILKEKLADIQWIAIMIVICGVAFMTAVYGQFPWISLFLAFTWGTYGLMRKKSQLNAIEGLLLETSLLSIPAFAYLIYLIYAGSFSFLKDVESSLLLAGTGILSGLPLIIFISGARIIKLSLIGILQYIYPTIIFLIGYYIYDETLTEAKLIGFIFIWVAIILYTFGRNIKFRTDTKKF